MAGNHLESLVAEWYEFNGYFVRRNVRVGRRPKGGYECELDVVAFNPEKGELVHIEPSWMLTTGRSASGATQRSSRPVV